jgi:hypothetical protein
MPETSPWRDRGEYYILPDDPLAALNILREAAGLEPWPDTDDRSVPDLPRSKSRPRRSEMVMFWFGATSHANRCLVGWEPWRDGEAHEA